MLPNTAFEIAQHANQQGKPVSYRFDEVLFFLRHVIHCVALSFEVLQHFVDAAKHIQIGCRPNIALIWRETEDSDGHFLLCCLLLGQAVHKTS